MGFFVTAAFFTIGAGQPAVQQSKAEKTSAAFRAASSSDIERRSSAYLYPDINAMKLENEKQFLDMVFGNRKKMERFEPNQRKTIEILKTMESRSRKKIQTLECM